MGLAIRIGSRYNLGGFYTGYIHYETLFIVDYLGRDWNILEYE